MNRFGILFSLALALAGCGGDADRGESCEEGVTCDEGLHCVSLAIGCTDDCPGTCEKVCETDADCGGDEVCTSTRGERICEAREFSPN